MFSLPLHAYYESSKRGKSSFSPGLNDLDRKAYRSAIERWEAEGGATLDLDGGVELRVRGMHA